MSLTGNIATFPVATLLKLMHEEGKTGCLKIRRQGHETRIVFRQGTVVCASSPGIDMRLGTILKNEGKITEAELAKGLSDARKTGWSLGKCLCEAQAVSHADLTAALREQAVEVIYNLHLWDSGDFEYVDEAIAMNGLIGIELNPMKLVLEALRRLDEMSHFKNYIPSDDLIFSMSDSLQNEKKIKLNADEWRILSCLDGTRTVDGVIEMSGFTPFAVYKSLTALLCLDVIEKKTVAKKRATQQPETSPTKKKGLFGLFKKK